MEELGGIHLACYESEHFKDSRFNEIYKGKYLGEDLVSKLDQLEESKKEGEPVAEGRGGVKQEEESGVITFEVENTKQGGSAFGGQRPIFVDPVETLEREDGAKVPERQQRRRKRHVIYGILVESLTKHHPSIVRAAEAEWGNIHGLLTLALSRVGAKDPSTYLDAIIEAVNLRKEKQETWEKFCERVFSAKTAVQSIEDPMYKLPAGVLVEVCLRSMTRQGSTPFVNAAALLRMERPAPNVDRVLTRIIEVVGGSGDSGVRGGGTQLTALQARTQSGSGHGSKGGKEQCYQWRDTGKCRYGDRCRFSHEKVSGTGQDRCYECGSRSHGIQNCSKFKQRKDAEKARGQRAALAQMEEAEEEQEREVLAARLARTHRD